jgi:peptide/nickel transport system substrate-binding protein
MKRVLWVLMVVTMICSLSAISCTSSSSSTPNVTQTPTITTTVPPVPTTSVATTPVVPSASSTTSTAKPTPTPTATSSTATNYGGTLKILRNRSPGGPIGWPASVLGGDEEFIYPAVETLVRLDSSSKILPWLATGWTIAQDKSSITFQLRKGVKFHDGTDFNAQAAKFNLDAVMAAKKAGTLSWTSVAVVDDYTVRVNLTSYDNTILPNLAGAAGMIVSPTTFQKNGIDWAQSNPIGTGPFKFASFQRDVALTFVKNPNYWQTGKPYLEGVQFIIVADSMTREAAFKSMSADILTDSDPKVMYDIQPMGINFNYQPDGVYWFYPDSVNANSPLSSVKVRQAMEYAVDKSAITNALFFGLRQASYQPCVPSSIGNIPNLAGRTYNVDKAKQLLTEAGYANGFKTKLIYVQPNDGNLAALIQNYLSKVGITSELEYADSSKYAGYRTSGWSGFIVGPGSTNNLQALQQYFQQPNYYVSVKKPAGLDDAINKAIKTDEVQADLVQQAVKILVDDATVVPLFSMGTARMETKNVHETGFNTLGSMSQWTPENTWLSK